MMQAYGGPVPVEVPSRPSGTDKGLAEVFERRRVFGVGDSAKRKALRCCVLGTSALFLRSRVARAVGDRSIDAAVNIGRDANKRRRQRMSQQDRKKLRITEVRRKIQVLKGRKGASKAQSEEEPSADAEESPGATEEAGEAQDGWAFQRTAKARSGSSALEVSDDARAVADTELDGVGGIASSRQLLDAAMEFQAAKDFDKAASLLELVSPKISEEQLQRKLDYKVAQEYDDEASERLASVYASSGRLTLAFNAYDVLRMRATDPQQRKRAEVGWVEVAMKIGKRLQEAYRYQECLDLLLTVRDVAQTRVAGEKLMEEAEMTIAMCLQKVGKKDQALQLLQEIKRTTRSRDRKAQAEFIMDVMMVDLPDMRNDEFHKVWDENFNLPKDMTRVVSTGGRRAVNLNLSTQERAFRTWASEYWEERLKSPAYYFFLTLWVTWPFAIPVVSMMRRSGVLESLS